MLASNMRAILSSQPVITCAPLGLKEIDMTTPPCPSKLRTGLPSASVHSRAVLSALAEATSWPLGLTCTAVIAPACPAIGRAAGIVSGQALTRPSAPDVSNSALFGWNARPVTAPECAPKIP